MWIHESVCQTKSIALVDGVVALPSRQGPGSVAEEGKPLRKSLRYFCHASIHLEGSRRKPGDLVLVIEILLEVAVNDSSNTVLALLTCAA